MKKRQLNKLLFYDVRSGIFFDKKTMKVVGTKGEDGYIYIWLNGHKHRADKLAWLCMKGEYPKHDLIHKDGIKINNWISNLEELKPIQKKKTAKNNKSGVTGVYWDKKNEKWRAVVTIQKYQIHLGSFDDFDQAVLARYFGEKEYKYNKKSTPAEQYVKKMFY